MPLIVHTLIAFLLVIGHGFFLLRGLYLRRNGGKPGVVDKIARSVSHFGLPLAILSGFFSESSEPAALHLILGLLPLAAIMVFTPFLSLRRRISWLLPSINLVLIVLAVLSGFMVGF